MKWIDKAYFGVYAVAMLFSAIFAIFATVVLGEILSTWMLT